MFKVPDKFRITNGPLASGDLDGNNGAFLLWKGSTEIFCIASDGGGWEHVSVSIKGKKKIPSWETMCFIKMSFWEEEDAVVQFHPPKSEYVNNHPRCLHLWRRSGQNPEMPPSIMTGSKELGQVTQ